MNLVTFANQAGTVSKNLPHVHAMTSALRSA